MLEIQKSVINYKSSNGIDTVYAYAYRCATVAPRAILQISHGMCEYIGRYDDFANTMAQYGFVVYGNDHLGHGQTSQTAESDGYFGDANGRNFVLQDLHTLNQMAHKEYPTLPLVLLGHSMGSFFARLYAVEYADTLQGLILSGTGGPNPLGGVGVWLTKLIGNVRGTHYRSNLIHKMAFDAYLKKIENPNTPHDWISTDASIVAQYAKDPKCTFRFTVSAFHEMMQVLNTVNKPAVVQKMRKDLPVYVFSGAMDPVGDYGKGVQTVYQMLCDADISDVSLKLYPDGRHEMLNEVNRKDVYTDVCTWCEQHVLSCSSK